MRTVLLIVFVSLLTTKINFAQDAKKWNYQFDMGMNRSIPYTKHAEQLKEFEGHPQTNYSGNWSYFAELLVSYRIGERHSLVSGLNYSASSISVDDQIGVQKSNGHIRRSYLKLPVLFRYWLFQQVPLSVAAGPYLGYRIKAREKGTAYLDLSSLDVTYAEPEFLELANGWDYNNNIKGGFTSIDYGLILQADYEISFSEKLKGVLLCRFDYGLKNVATTDISYFSSADKWRNYAISVGLGVKF